MTSTLPIFAINQGEFGDCVRDALGTAFGRLRSPAKMLARAADVNIATAKNWLDGKSTPHGLHLLRLFATVPELNAELRRLMAMERDGDPDMQRAINDLVAVALRRRQAELEAE